MMSARRRLQGDALVALPVRSGRLCAALAAFCTVMAPSAPAGASAPCRVVDAYAPVARVAEATVAAPSGEQVRVFEAKVIAPHPGLYAPSVLGLQPGPRMDAKILTSLAEARASRDRAELVRRLSAEVERVSGAFGRFGDFRCNFPIYLSDTLGQLDGAGRIVDGRRALVLGVDVLDGEQKVISLPTFVAHELFHRYHYEAAGFSDDLSERQPIWRALWAEGLATYVSRVITPGASTADALMLPADLEQTAGPKTAVLAADLLRHLDEVNPEVFTTYFTYGNKDVSRRGLPWRSGYYLGYRVAERLARRHPLEALVHLKGAPLRAEIGQTLAELAAGRGSQ
jgi:hypothetical protein